MDRTAPFPVRRALELLRRILSEGLVFLLVLRLLIVALLSVPVAAVARGLFALSGRRTVANADFLIFALSPIGLVTLVGIASAAAILSVLRHAGLFALTVSAARGHRLRWWEALLVLTRNWRTLAALAVRIVVRILLVCLPFLGALALIQVTLLSEFDINDYLTERPPALRLALWLGGLVVVGMLATGGALLGGWSLSLQGPGKPTERLAGHTSPTSRLHGTGGTETGQNPPVKPARPAGGRPGRLDRWILSGLGTPATRPPCSR